MELKASEHCIKILEDNDAKLKVNASAVCLLALYHL